MTKSGLSIVGLMVAGSLVTSPTLAYRKTANHPAVSCKDINDALGTGKSVSEVAKELNTSLARVKMCATPSPARHLRHPGHNGG